MSRLVTADHLIRELRALTNPARAERDKTYHKSAREHWGLTAPALDQVIKPFVKQHPVPVLHQVSQALWQTQVFDLMMAGGRILSQKKVPASDELWTLVTTYLGDVDGWALEDNLAHAAWKCLLASPARLDEIEGWTEHPNAWMRRAALIYTLPYAKSGRNPERMLQWAGKYASDPEWFIQKAIGWWLRKLGQYQPEQAVNFLNQHWDALQHVARKEATRKLHPAWRQHIHGLS